MAKGKSMDMLHGPLLGKLMLLAVPIVLSSILQQLFNTADIAVAGKFISSGAMAAVGSNAPVISLFISLVVGLSIGANVLVAAKIGQKKYDAVGTSVQTSMSIALVVGVAMVFLGLLIARPILELMAAPADIIDMAELYLQIYFLGMPFIMIYNFGSAVLRADGDSRRPLYCLVVSSLSNLVMDLLFSAVLPWGIAGIALATTIANGISAGLILYYLVKEKGYLHLSLRDFQLERRSIRQIVSIGGPAGIQGVVFSLSNVVIQAAINSFGSDAVAGVSAALNFEFFTYYIVSGFARAAVTFTSQNYAVRNFARCREIFRLSQIAAIGFTAILSGVFIFFRYPLLHVFTVDAGVMDYALIRLLIVTTLEFMTSLYEIPGSCLRGMGVSLLPAIETLFGSCLLRIAFILTIFWRMPDFTLLTVIYPITWLITGAMVMGSYFIIRRRLFAVRQA